MVRRVVSNIEAFHSEKQDEFLVVSYLLAYRSRPSAPEGSFYVVARHDTMRRSGTDWRLARRHAQLDHIVIYDGALSTLL
jgi:3-phenylpropionate/cinnamic acid dioxygenase small subunit